MLRTLAIIVAITASANAMATTTSIDWDFTKSNIDANGTWTAGSNTSSWRDASEISVGGDSSTLSVAVTAWSDSVGVTGATSGKEKYDQVVTEADLYYWGSSYGWGIVNNDETENGVPDHSIDNYSGNSYYSDQDMVLLSFSEAVSLEGISVGWISSSDGSSSYNLNNVGAVAISQTSVDNMGVNDSMWDDIYNEVDMSTISYQSTSGNSKYYSLDNNDPGTSKFWLVGLYNEMENCDYDAFKLMGVTAKTSGGGGGTPPVDVPEPSSIAIFALGLAFIVRQKKLSTKFKLNF